MFLVLWVFFFKLYFHRVNSFPLTQLQCGIFFLFLFTLDVTVLPWWGALWCFSWLSALPHLDLVRKAGISAARFNAHLCFSCSWKAERNQRDYMFQMEETPLPLGCLCEPFACSAVVSRDSSLHRFTNKYSLVTFSTKVQDKQFALCSVGQHSNNAVRNRTCQGVFWGGWNDEFHWVKLFWRRLCAKLVQLQGWIHLTFYISALKTTIPHSTIIPLWAFASASKW